MKTAYIVKAYRTAVGKAPRGLFRFKRPDELAAETMRYLLDQVPQLDKNRIDDVILGSAMPEAEQGLNVARLVALMGSDTESIAGVTVNRYCASGLETIALATAKIQSGMANCIIAGGMESMSYIPMGGYKPSPDYQSAITGHSDYYWNMGLTAEEVAKQYKVNREDQDQFAYESHQKALAALAENRFKDQIVPITVSETYLDTNQKRAERTYVVDTDEGPRADTSLDKLAKLRPVFADGGTVTAGNASQMSDGAAFTLVMSEEMVKEFQLEPIARLVSYAATGVPPRIMGIGPVEAIPKALKMANLKKDDVLITELNEAFAAQSLAVIRELELDPSTVNVNGGAIALGHPLGCTGTKLSVQLFDEMRKRSLKGKHGMVTMCVGTGQGAAGIFEFIA